MERRGFQNDEGTFLLDLVKLSLGVFIGALAAMVAYEAINVWRLERAARQLVHQAQQQENASRAQAARQQQQERENRQQQQEEQEAIRRAAQLAQGLERERRARKEAAWSAFYQPSPACRADAVTAACANEHIAAKKRFDAQYVDR